MAKSIHGQNEPEFTGALIGAHSETDSAKNKADFLAAFSPWKEAKERDADDVKTFEALRDEVKTGKIAALLYAPLDYGNLNELDEKFAKARAVLVKGKSSKEKRTNAEQAAYVTSNTYFYRAFTVDAKYVTPVTQGRKKELADAAETRKAKDAAKKAAAEQEALKAAHQDHRATIEAAKRAASAIARKEADRVTIETPMAFLEILQVERQFLLQLVARSQDKAPAEAVKIVQDFCNLIGSVKI